MSFPRIIELPEASHRLHLCIYEHLSRTWSRPLNYAACTRILHESALHHLVEVAVPPFDRVVTELQDPLRTATVYAAIRSFIRSIQCAEPQLLEQTIQSLLPPIYHAIVPHAVENHPLRLIYCAPRTLVLDAQPCPSPVPTVLPLSPPFSRSIPSQPLLPGCY